MSAQLRKYAEFFLQVAQGTRQLIEDKEKFIQLINYEVSAVIFSLSRTSYLKERDFEMLFRGYNLPYNKTLVKRLLFTKTHELTAQQLCDYLGIGRIYAQKKYKTVKLSPQQVRKFLHLLSKQCIFNEKIDKYKRQFAEPAVLHQVFEQIDFFQNGYIDAYAISEFVKYYTKIELDSVVCAQVVDLFSKNNRIDIEAFMGFFSQTTTAGLSSTYELNHSLSGSELPLQKLGKIQKNSPNKMLQRHASLNKFNTRINHHEDTEDNQNSLDQYKRRHRELKSKKPGFIPERYRDVRDTKQKELLRHRKRQSMDRIPLQSRQKQTSQFFDSHAEFREYQKNPVRRKPLKVSSHAFKSKHPRNFQILQQLRNFKQDRSLQTLVSQFENHKKETQVEQGQDHAKYQQYLQAKGKNRLKQQLKVELGKLSELLDNRQVIIKQLVKGYEHFNAFHGFNILDTKQVGFLDFREFFKAIERIGVETSDQDKKAFWKECANLSAFSFQNYLKLFDLKWNRSYYDQIRSRQPLTLDFLDLESWSSDLQLAYLQFLGSIIQNTSSIRRQKYSIYQQLNNVPGKNLPKFLTDRQQIDKDEFTKLFGQKCLNVFTSVGQGKSLTSELVHRYLGEHR